MSFLLWVLFFCYSTSAALIFQKVVLPRFPSLHAGFGLLDGDSIYFHRVASELAERIRDLGWAEWQIYPAPAATGNVAILAALYALFGPDPSLIVPLNAAVHAACGVLLYRIGNELLGGTAGAAAGILASTLFVVFPSALNWYGQIHKDGYAIAGLLLVLWAWVRVIGREIRKADAVFMGVATAGAVVLIALVRPYALILLAAVLVLVLSALVGIRFRALRLEARALALCAASILLIGVGAIVARNLGVEERYGIDPALDDYDPEGWDWSRSLWLPAFADERLEAIARTRARFLAAGVKAGAGSMIDANWVPSSAGDVAAYLPRALQIALFAPFPESWLAREGPAHRVATGEMLIWYLLAPGVVLSAWHASAARLAVVLCFALAFLAIYGIAIPNIGTLYRIRAPFIGLLMLVGAIGWAGFLRRYLTLANRKAGERAPLKPILGSQARMYGNFGSEVLSPGAAVSALTALGFLGFFARDAILARWYGTGTELDAYYVAVAVPTLLVAVISAPLGPLVTARYLEVRHQRSQEEAQRFVSRVLAAYAPAILLVILLIAAGAGPLLSVAGWDLSDEALTLAKPFLLWMLPILGMSGFVIVANAVLCAHGASATAAAAQLAVPALSIAVLIAAGDRFGVLAAIVGMLAGQAVNLEIVATALRRFGVSIAPAWPPFLSRSDFSLYASLTAAATVSSVAVPVNLAMASTLGLGAVAAFGLGTKIMTFVGGIVGAAVASVVLPRLAAMMARQRLLDMRSELSFMLLGATASTIPVSLALFTFSEEIACIAFGGGAFGTESVETVGRVIANTVIQLPFLTANLLLLNFSVAMKSAGTVFAASVLAVSVNVGLNLPLSEHAGVGGIALASTVATAVATLCLLSLFARYAYVSWVNVVMLVLSWMPYATLLICLHYGNYVGASGALVALVVVLRQYWLALGRGEGASRT